jgi:hypothetical protein
MLRDLGGEPRVGREVRAWLIGRLLGILCHVSGWFLPMYGAGRLESRNVGEYVVAARYAVDCNRMDLAPCLLAMAEVEWDHEAYFRGKVEGHAGLRWFQLWPALLPRQDIRGTFASQRPPSACAEPSVGRDHPTASV